MRTKIAFWLAFHKDKRVIPYLRDLYDQETGFYEKVHIIAAFGHVIDRSDIPYLRKIYDTAYCFLKLEIAHTIGMGGDVETAIDLFKDLLKQMDDPVDQFMISHFLNYFGEEKVAIKQLSGVFSKITPYDFSDLRSRVIQEVLSAVKKGNLLIFGGENGRWELIEIPRQYSFGSLSNCNFHNQDQNG